MSQGVHVLGGKCPGGKCPGGKCPEGICPWGKCPGGTCQGGLCPRTCPTIAVFSLWETHWLASLDFSDRIHRKIHLSDILLSLHMRTLK